ncbi:amino acid permease [Streptoalloteichus tenebrarius]|nr:amino acid permease [Streptoalloteichus tenebrarius]
MIAIGGAIGVGLFLGVGGRLEFAGPGLMLSYAISGIAAFFVMRALGELVMHRPTAGSFVEYAREFIGPWAGYASGWMFWVNWAMTGIAEITAAALYVERWLPDVPQWITALVALAVLLTVNLLSVKLFGEMEFWFALVKAIAIILFLFVGLSLVVTGAGVGDTGYHAGLHNLTDHGGFLPKGFGVVLMALQGVVFAFAAIEMVGIAAGETDNPRKVVPKAINSVVWRIAFFYIGSVLLLTLVLPWTVYRSDESPFVTVFSAIGLPAAGDVMNAVVLTAALSSCNSGLYSTGRILRSLASRGEAPAFTARMSRRHVPYGGILFTAVVYLFGVFLNYWVPKDAFDIAVNVASLGVITTWMTLLYSQIRFRQKVRRGEVEPSTFRMPGAPVSGWLTLAFLVGVLVLMVFSDDWKQQVSVGLAPVLAVVLAVGWWVISRRRRPGAAPGASPAGGPRGGGATAAPKG